MATYDRKLRRVVVRAVYDGPGHAGKTTNLKQLVSAFTSARRGELVSPGEVSGRTLYFDWLHLDGGVVCGHPLRCQLLTAPGQSLLAKRRWAVIDTADVLVFVCESSNKGMKEAKRWLELLRAKLASREVPPPLIVQANKQDLPGALDPEAIARALELPPEVPIVPARAAEGIGVRETVVLAIREAANLAQQAVLAGGVDGLSEADEDPARLLDELQRIAMPTGARWMRASSARRAPRDGGTEDESGPPLPSADAPSGLVWPPSKGRTLVRAVTQAKEKGQVERLAARAGSASIVVRAGTLCLKTSRARRFDDADAAKKALEELARRRLRIGTLNAAGTALALVEDDEGAIWLWTASPWVNTIASIVDDARAKGRLPVAARALARYGTAGVDAMSRAVRDRVQLAVDPQHYGLHGEDLAYISDRIEAGTDAAAIARALLLAFDEHAKEAELSRLYADAIAAALLETRALRPELASAFGRAAREVGHDLGPDAARLVAALVERPAGISASV